MSKARRFVFPLIAMSIGLILSGIAVEGVLRLLGAPASDLYTVTEKQFNEVPGIYEPGQEIVRTVNKHLPHRVSINPLGYRGPEFPREKPSGETRIFMAGDSFVFGEYVEEDETMPARLGALLRDKCSDVQVVNAGLLGGTIVGETRLIERGLVLEPDMVILVFHDNDLTDLSSPLWEGVARNRAAKSKFPMSFLYPVLRDTATWNFALKVRRVAQERWARDAQGSPDSEEGPAEPAESVGDDDARERYERALRDLRDFLQARGIAFTFVTYPGHSAMEGHEGKSSLVQWAADLAKGLDIPTLNLLGPLRDNLTPSATYLLPWDGHPSAEGHRVAARAVSEHLLGLEPMKSACQAGLR